MFRASSKSIPSSMTTCGAASFKRFENSRRTWRSSAVEELDKEASRSSISPARAGIPASSLSSRADLFSFMERVAPVSRSANKRASPCRGQKPFGVVWDARKRRFAVRRKWGRGGVSERPLTFLRTSPNSCSRANIASRRGATTACPFIRIERSFITQGHQWIDIHGAARGDITGDESGGRQQEGNRCKRERVGRLHAKEEAREQSRKGERNSESKRNPENRQLCAASHDEATHVARLSAKGHADSDFASPLADGIAHDTVNSNGGEHERENGKDCDQHGGKTARRDGVRKQVVHSHHLRDRQRGVGFVDDV